MEPKSRIYRQENRRIKRAIDIMAAFGGILLLSPLLCLVPLAIKIQSSGPVIFRRGVVGRNGVPFSAYKFRTMVENAENILEQNPDLKKAYLQSFKLKTDPRITKVGYLLRKFSLDEIPQLFNVLKGQMSVVGPRMMASDELRAYGALKKRVLSVKPGLTGLWQVSGRQELPFTKRMELDMYYIDNWSVFSDIRIMLKTVSVVLKGEGAY